MNNQKISFSPTFMTAIRMNYVSAANDIDNIINELKKVTSSFQSNYTGMADDIISEGFPKITEHLDLLKDCCSKTADYVYYSWQTMDDTDRAGAAAMAGVAAGAAIGAGVGGAK